MNDQAADFVVQDLASAMQLEATGASRAGDPFSVALVTGFTAIHLRAFLAANLVARLPTRRIEVQTHGHWGQLRQNLMLAEQARPQAAAVCIEWDDLDPRLGSRSCAPPPRTGDRDIVMSVKHCMGEIIQCLKRLSSVCPVALSLPNLPLLPLSGPPRRFANPLNLQLQSIVLDAAVEISETPSLRMVSSEFLNETSPVTGRRDLRAEFRSGSPYRTTHLAALCEGLAELLVPRPQKKGLITDLDNTLWKGIVGEAGVDGISWDLQGASQIHAVYQRLLSSLASAGTLIAIASRNNPDVVAKALARTDLILPASTVFPVVAGWGPKSVAVQQILTAWNVAADSVVFVDDSPLELAEVNAAFPAIRCLQFPAEPDRVLESVLLPLRELFGKLTVDRDDLLRSESIRASALRDEQAKHIPFDEFLQSVHPELSIEWNKPDRRSFDLVNKTNQFNLNGRRIDEASWLNKMQDSASLVLTAAYQDRFGPLGKVAVMAGTCSGTVATIDVWVLSCRAFSRRIEFQMLDTLFQTLNVSVVEFDFVATERNGPLQDFLLALGIDLKHQPVQLRRSDFESLRPVLPFTVHQL